MVHTRCKAANKSCGRVGTETTSFGCRQAGNTQAASALQLAWRRRGGRSMPSCSAVTRNSLPGIRGYASLIISLARNLRNTWVVKLAHVGETFHYAYLIMSSRRLFPPPKHYQTAGRVYARNVTGQVTPRHSMADRAGMADIRREEATTLSARRQQLESAAHRRIIMIWPGGAL